MQATEKRLGRPVTFAEALGGKDDGPLEPNQMEQAVCARCGLEPRLYHHTSPGGREVIVWIPQEHKCRGNIKI